MAPAALPRQQEIHLRHAATSHIDLYQAADNEWRECFSYSTRLPREVLYRGIQEAASVALQLIHNVAVIMEELDMRPVVYLSICLSMLLPLSLATAAETSIGQREYESKCVMCHGPSGKGDGWFTRFLNTRPTTITQLKKNNGGVFPFDRVYQVIDGRKEVSVHGSRDMPVWGAVYRAESGKEYDPYYGLNYVDEGMVRARILALIEYISRLQE
jgi:hypothetical protein